MLVVDAQAGTAPERRARASDLLRESEKPWLLVGNKVDDPRATDFYEFYDLGAGDPLPVSAQQRQGSRATCSTRIVEHLPRARSRSRPRCGWPSSAGRTSASRRSSTACSARSGWWCADDGGHHARRHRHAACTYHGRELIFVDTAGLRRQTQDRRGHRVLLLAAHASRDRACRHLRAPGGRHRSACRTRTSRSPPWPGRRGAG